MLLKEGLFHRYFLSLEIFENGQILTPPFEWLKTVRLLLTYFNLSAQKFLSAKEMWHLTLIKKFLQIAVLEPTP